jgi:hypothetical protein
MFKGKHPDVTTAQLLAVAGWIAAQAVAYGWLSTEQSQTLLSGGATIVAAAWKIADSLLRGKRNEVEAAKAGAKK